MLWLTYDDQVTRVVSVIIQPAKQIETFGAATAINSVAGEGALVRLRVLR